MSKSKLESKFKTLWSVYFPELIYQEEHTGIIPNRKFRVDFAWINSKVIVEINGQTWQKGGHSSGKGLYRDYEKLNLAQANGWVVFQLSSEMITYPWLGIVAKTITERQPLQ